MYIYNVLLSITSQPSYFSAYIKAKLLKRGLADGFLEVTESMEVTECLIS